MIFDLIKKMAVVIFVGAFSIGCGDEKDMGGGLSSVYVNKAEIETFTLAWSEYPSWVIFGAASDLGLIKPKGGEMGELEKKWNVDIVLHEASYSACVDLYMKGMVDAVCVTNMDVMAPSLRRESVVLFPTSTSDGADACLVKNKIKNLKELEGFKIYGLPNSVNEFVFDRALIRQGYLPRSYQFVEMDLFQAISGLRDENSKIDAIVTWNPYVLQLLSEKRDIRVILDSSSMPEEIIDMIVMGKDSASRAGADLFAYAIMMRFIL